MEECQQSQWTTVPGLFKTLIQIENNKTFLCWLAGLLAWQMRAKINFRGQFIITDIEWGLEGLELLSMTLHWVD